MRIAIVLPTPRRGATLGWCARAAVMLARGAACRGRSLEVVISCLDGVHHRQDFGEALAAGARVRPTRWRAVAAADAEPLVRRLPWTGSRRSAVERFLIPDDENNGLLDADFWVFANAAVEAPVLALRPYGVYVADCLERHVPAAMLALDAATEASARVPFVRGADFVLATTPSTVRDIHSYLGVRRARIAQIPLAVDAGLERHDGPPAGESPYFVWLADGSSHRTHERYLRALDRYHAGGGALGCLMVGPQAEALRAAGADSRGASGDPGKSSPTSRFACDGGRVEVAGELAREAYVRALGRARFVLIPDPGDDGWHGSVDAACLGVPALCAHYPVQDDVDRLLELGPARFDPRDADGLPAALARMEREAPRMPPVATEHLRSFHWENQAGAFYDTVIARVEGCLGRHDVASE